MIDRSYAEKPDIHKTRRELPNYARIIEWFENPENNALDKIRRKLDKKIEDLENKIFLVSFLRSRNMDAELPIYVKRDLEHAVYIKYHGISTTTDICWQCNGSGYDSNAEQSACCCTCYGTGRLFINLSTSEPFAKRDFRIQKFLVGLIREIINERITEPNQQ